MKNWTIYSLKCLIHHVFPPYSYGSLVLSVVRTLLYLEEVPLGWTWTWLRFWVSKLRQRTSEAARRKPLWRPSYHLWSSQSQISLRLLGPTWHWLSRASTRVPAVDTAGSAAGGVRTTRTYCMCTWQLQILKTYEDILNGSWVPHHGNVFTNDNYM